MMLVTYVTADLSQKWLPALQTLWNYFKGKYFSEISLIEINKEIRKVISTLLKRQ